MINCIAIDDEPLALKQLQKYIEKTPKLSLVHAFESALGASAFLGDHSVDLMFVDINMPDLNGMDFVKSLLSPPQVIFTTAYSEYAIDGFKVNALDYLLKPIAYADFLKSSNKAITFFEERRGRQKKAQKDTDFLLIKSGYQVIRLDLSQIKYIEGMKEYVRIHLDQGDSIMTLASMKKMEEQLPSQVFMRVHRSYIVRLDKVTTIERNRIIFDSDIYIPVSKPYQPVFQRFLRDNFLQ